MRALSIALVWMSLTGGLARAQPCPIPELGLHIAAADSAYDHGLNAEVLATLAVAVERDAARATTSPLTVGAELAALHQDSSDPRLVAARTGSLAAQLWQLDCAVLRGQAATAGKLYRELGAEIAALRPPGSAPVPVLPIKPGFSSLRIAYAVAPNPRRARAYRVGGGVLLGLGLAMIGGAIAVTVNDISSPCDSSSSLCGLGNGLSKVGEGVLWGLGGVSTITGVVLLALWGRERVPRVQPTLQLTPGGGGGSVRLSF